MAMTRHWVLSAAVAALGMLCGAAALADDPAPADEAQIAKLIEQLDAPRFADRQDAQQKLGEAGKAALPAVEKASQSENREVSGRAIEILERHFKGDDEQLKAAAKECLERLARNESESVARRAKEIVSPPQPPMPPAVPNVPNLRIGGARIQIQVGNAGGNFRKVTVKNINGVKETEVEENGRKVKIVDDPANGIKLEVTETKDGKETTKKYEAKNAEELKTKHPEAHKLYEEFAQGPAGIRIQGIQIGPGGAIPIPAAVPAARNIRRAKILRPDELDEAKGKVQDALKDLDSSLETLRKEAEKNGELKGAVEKAEAAKKRLEELKEKLES
jgi:hypothetical protein